MKAATMFLVVLRTAELHLASLATRQISHDVSTNAACPPDEWDDAQLASALLEKDPRAARVAWDRFAPMVRRMLRRSLGPQHELEDLVQDVFLCLFQRVTTLRDPRALKAFVVAITVRTTRYNIRRAKVRRWVMLSPTSEAPEARALSADGNTQHALIHFYRLLERLHERDRVAFVLRYIEGMAAAEVAEALEVSVPTARRAFTHAWERIALLAQRDPFLHGYLQEFEGAAVEDWPQVMPQPAFA
jgi:RNA polymerase sigma-70 factor, ECF subfamily